MPNNAHKLIRQDRGAKLWGQCSCGEWCWLGTYHWPRGRLATLRAEHAKHLQYVHDNSIPLRDGREEIIL